MKCQHHGFYMAVVVAWPPLDSSAGFVCIVELRKAEG